MSPRFTESEAEEACLEWLSGLGYTISHGPDLEPEGPSCERQDFGQVVLEDRLKDALTRLNPTLPADALDQAFRKVIRAEGVSLLARNRQFHKWLVEGVDVEYRRKDGSIAGDKAKIVSPNELEKNDWLAVNQVTIKEGQQHKRPDVVIFINGLPVAVIELKNPVDENATVWTAFTQLQNYKAQIPALFTYNELLIATDGLEARLGSLTSNRERFMPWRTTDGEEIAAATIPQLDVLIKGVFDKRRLLDLLTGFVVFEDDGTGTVVKKLAGYHQYHAVQIAIEETVRASRPNGNKKIGVVWHTQGSGKSLTMVYYAARIIQHAEMANPTVVVITDRNDLDGQLFGNFSLCIELLRDTPVQADSRTDLREKLKRASGGIIFTTIQKFMTENKGDKHPLLSDRRNIVVMADEAHRGQYDFIDGFARHVRDALPHASFIGFTGTPLERDDRNTRHVFGEHISVYDIEQAVKDGATVPIYYESRLARLEMKEAERPKVDPEFEEATEGEEVAKKERLKSRWAALEGLVGTKKRLKLIAKDLVDHFEKRHEVLDGKAMVVCMSRRICVDLYNEIVALRPQWHDAEDDKGQIKVIMTGSSADLSEFQPHVRNKPRRDVLAKRFKKSSDPFKIVIVRDMWLTGFDAPCLHTMYVDKPMKSHGLMQAIARVNRVFKDKPGGLVVDYLGLADQLKKALAEYTESEGKGRPTINQAEAVAKMLEKHEVCCDLFHGFNWDVWRAGKPTQRMALLPLAQEHILAQEDGKDRLVLAVTELTKAFALSVPHPEALRIRDDVAFFQAVKGALAKRGTGDGKPQEEVEHAIRQIVSKAISPEGMVDIFAAAGLKKPDISILSDEFLAEIKGMKQKNLAVETLRKLLEDEIKLRKRKHLIQARSFLELLEESLRKYKSRAIETAKIIEELISLAKTMREASKRGDDLGLSDDEVAFYEALEINDSAVKVLGDDTLKSIARDLVDTLRKNTSIDWTVRESVRARLRVAVKRVLKKHGYPPDKQEKATQTVLEQAELMAEEGVEGFAKA